MSDTAIEPGDFVGSRLIGSVCGIVVRAETVAAGKLPGYIVRLANGREDFIAAEDTELIAVSEDHMARLIAAGKRD